MQQAGRHSSYATQFWTRRAGPPHRTRLAAQTAHSRKVIHRRLVLPLDAQNWPRALEILGARYAKLGRTAEDYQRVVRAIAEDSGCGTRPECRAVAVGVLDSVRDAAFAGEVPSTASLWTSLVWAYAQLRCATGGYDCLRMAERRCTLSPPTRRHLASVLLPHLANAGMADAAADLARHGGAECQRLVAEAAARSGVWEAAAAADLSAPALRAAMGSAADDTHCEAALACLAELRRRGEGVAELELQRLLNALGGSGRWAEAVALVREEFLRPAHNAQTPTRPLSATTLNLVFAAFPPIRVADMEEIGTDKRVGENTGEERDLAPIRAAVALLDDLLRERDDVRLTDWVLDAVAPALILLGEWDRALGLLQQSDSISSARHVRSGPADRAVQRRLIALVCHMHRAGPLSARESAETRFPHLLPRHTRGPVKPDSITEKEGSVERERESLLGGHSTPRRRSLVVQRTEAHDAVLRRRLETAAVIGNGAFNASRNAERDPRPVPKGLHDSANGWNFFGRGGEMVFRNHKRTANPHSLHPKVMRALADPYRGWNPWLNSSLAHRERVQKWNGRSAV